MHIVFVRRDAVKPPLQPPYDGPFRIIKRTDKFFVLDLNSKWDTIAIDQLKVAYLNDDLTPVYNQPTDYGQCTR